jgi:RNA polymerase sigma-70 factor (ECF subfamily)
MLTYATTIEDAADLTQYVFVKVLEALPSYRHGSTPLSAWLFRIARNAAIDAYRRQRRVLPWDHLPEDMGSWPAEGPESASLHADDLNRLRILVAQLDQNKQELLALRFAADLTLVEIAALLGKRESAVQKQLSRIIQRLKEQFHESSSDAEVRAKYADIIKEEGDPQTVHLVRTLATAYKSVRPPVGLPPTRADLARRVDRLHPRFSIRRRWSRGLSLTAAFVLVLTVAGIAYAVSTDRHHTTYQHTQAVVRSFVRAYNHHDLHGVLSLFTPSARYSDCDWVRQTPRFAIGQAELRRLFQREFADNERFVRPKITTANPQQRYVAGLDFLQTSRSMQRRGIAPHAGGFKIVLETTDYQRIEFIAGLGPNGCHR